MRMTDEQRLGVIESTGRALIAYLRDSGINRDAIMGDRIVQWTITTPLYNIGEHVYCLSNRLKDAYPEIPWFRIAGMRHRLVHDYADTNWSIVADAVLNDVPAFIEQIKDIRSRL